MPEPADGTPRFEQVPEQVNVLVTDPPPDPQPAQLAAQVKGRIDIEDEVVEKVAGLAATEVDGVADLGGDVARVGGVTGCLRAAEAGEAGAGARAGDDPGEIADGLAVPGDEQLTHLLGPLSLLLVDQAGLSRAGDAGTGIARARHSAGSMRLR